MASYNYPAPTGQWATPPTTDGIADVFNAQENRWEPPRGTPAYDKMFAAPPPYTGPPINVIAAPDETVGPGIYTGVGYLGGGQARGSAPPPAPTQGSSQSQGGPQVAPGESRPTPGQPQPPRGSFGYAAAPAAFTPGAAPGSVAFGAAPTLAVQSAALPGAPAPPPSQPQPPAQARPQPVINPQAHQAVMQAPATNPLFGAIQNSMAAPTADQFNPWRRWQGWS